MQYQLHGVLHQQIHQMKIIKMQIMKIIIVEVSSWKNERNQNINMYIKTKTRVIAMLFLAISTFFPAIAIMRSVYTWMNSVQFIVHTDDDLFIFSLSVALVLHSQRLVFLSTSRSSPLVYHRRPSENRHDQEKHIENTLFVRNGKTHLVWVVG